MAHRGAIASLPMRFRLVAGPNEAGIVVIPAELAVRERFGLERNCEVVLTDVFSATRTQLEDVRGASGRVRIGEASLIAAADLMPYCAAAYALSDRTIMEVTIDSPARMTSSARLAEAFGIVVALGFPVDSDWTVTSTRSGVAATALWRNYTLALAHRIGIERSGTVDVSITAVRERILARGYFGGSARPARLERYSADGQLQNRPVFASPLRRYWMSARDGLWPETMAGMAAAPFIG